MSVQGSLNQIRDPWLHRITHSMARGADLRANFENELEQFFSLLEQAVVTGDPAWLDSILFEWATSATQSDLELGKYNVSLLLRKMVEVTNEVARETLTESEALDLLNALIPIYTYWLDKAARIEMDNRIAFISRELDSVQKQLEQLDRTKSNFVSVAAHELKTPLTLIEGYTSILHDMLKASGQNQYDDILLGVNKGVTRLHKIISDMIDVSMIDNDLLSLNFQQTTLSHMLSLIKSELDVWLKERRQILNIKQFPGINTWISVDTERLYQALRNILVNAIKYTPDLGKINVYGRTMQGFIEVVITDNGIGIDPEHQTAIFEKFAQFGRTELHSSGKTKFKGGGPGLGLPITRGIIEAHGGTVWVESDGYDEIKCPGSTFHVLIPIRADDPNFKMENLYQTEASNEDDAHVKTNS